MTLRHALGGAVLAVVLVFPASASAGCITTLPVKVADLSPFATSYPTKVPVKITTKGPVIRFVRVEMYSFAGKKVAQGRLSGPLRGTKTVVMKLLVGLKNGGYSLIVKGEPNANRSCGPKEHKKIVTFGDCADTLPVTFPEPPGGKAADYGDYLSVKVHPTGKGLHGLVGRLFSFAGEDLGEGRRDTLTADDFVNVKLTRRLTPGGYTFILKAFVDGQSERCPTKDASIELTFNDGSEPPPPPPPVPGMASAR